MMMMPTKPAETKLLETIMTMTMQNHNNTENGNWNEEKIAGNAETNKRKKRTEEEETV